MYRYGILKLWNCEFVQNDNDDVNLAKLIFNSWIILFWFKQLFFFDVSYIYRHLLKSRRFFLKQTRYC